MEVADDTVLRDREVLEPARTGDGRTLGGGDRVRHAVSLGLRDSGYKLLRGFADPGREIVAGVVEGGECLLLGDVDDDRLVPLLVPEAKDRLVARGIPHQADDLAPVVSTRELAQAHVRNLSGRRRRNSA